MKKLTLEQTKEVYDAYIHEHFPPEEVKPFHAIERMYADGGYEAYGMYDNDTFIGYAFLCRCPDSKVVLLDYLAVLQEYRCKGYGHQMLSELRTGLCDFSYLMIETEVDEFAADETEREIRKRRDHFYTDNGVIRTDIIGCVYDADYRIWYMPISASVSASEVARETLVDDYDDIYRYMLSEKGYQKFFSFKN